MSDSFSITLRLFAIYQEIYGAEILQWEIAPGTTVSQLLAQLIEEHPSLAEWAEVTRFGVNLDFVAPETILREGDEVVLIPPVSGG